MMLFITMPQSCTAAHRLSGQQSLGAGDVCVGTLPEWGPYWRNWDELGSLGSGANLKSAWNYLLFVFFLSGNNLTNFCQGEIVHSFNK